MIPYIALLIVLIVAILFSVYKQSEYFTVDAPVAVPIVVTANTNINTIADAGLNVINNTLKPLQVRANALGSTRLVYTERQKLALNIVPGKPPATTGKELSESLTEFINNGKEQLTAGKARFAQQNMITITDITKLNNMPRPEVVEGQVRMLNDFIQNIMKSIKDLGNILAATEATVAPGSRAATGTGAAAATAAATAAGTQYRFEYPEKQVVTGTAMKGPSGSKQVTFNVDDLMGAFGPIAGGLKGKKDESRSKILGHHVQPDMTKRKNETAGSVPNTTVTCASAPATSVSLSDETIQRLSKTLSTQMKDQALATRSTRNPMDYMDSESNDGGCSESTAQGSEFVNERAVPMPGFDKNEYIRKDSIPCWGCTLP